MYKRCLCFDMDSIEDVDADHRALTVGELRSMLKRFPEDAEVVIARGWRYNSDVEHTFFSERFPVSDCDLRLWTIMPDLEVEC